MELCKSWILHSCGFLTEPISIFVPACGWRTLPWTEGKLLSPGLCRLTDSSPADYLRPWEMERCRCGDGPGAIHQCHVLGAGGPYGMCHLED